LCGGLALVNEPTTQIFEKGIVANFMFVQVRTNWIRESAIKIKDVYYYYFLNIFKRLLVFIRPDKFQ
jgi:hypothetical protein